MNDLIQKLHEKQYEILEELKRVCDANGLVYFLTCGTLLGAVRHKGFIPWDDDIDVLMPIQDCQKLESLFVKGGCFRDRFFLQTPGTDPGCKMPFFRLRMHGTTFILKGHVHKDIHHGISIDIYPLYNVPDSRFMRKIQAFHAAAYALLELGVPPKNQGAATKIVANVLLLLFRGRLRTWYKNRCHRLMARYEGIKTACKSYWGGNLAIWRQTYPAGVFDHPVPLQFEQDFFSVPCGYDDFLKRKYGDYMKLPPPEKRGVKLEDSVAKIDLEKSYLEYKGVVYCVAGKQGKTA